MKKSFAALAVFLMLSPGMLFADCPSVSSSSCCGGYTWYTYAFELACGWTSSNNVGTGTMWCYNLPVHTVSYPVTSTETVTYQYTLPTSSSNWEIMFFVEFSNGGNGNNFVRADYTLTHNGVTGSSQNIFFSNSALSCSREDVWPISASAGDVLTITVQMKTASSGSYAQVSAPTLFRS
jgi:hypothetical protein